MAKKRLKKKDTLYLVSLILIAISLFFSYLKGDVTSLLDTTIATILSIAVVILITTSIYDIFGVKIK